MANNRTFFKKVAQGRMTLRDIFSDTFKKHSAEQTAQVFIAGTPLTTPREEDMLANWNKPFLFARFLLMALVFLGLCYVLQKVQGDLRASYLMMLTYSSMISLTLLLFFWELNIPRNIPLYEVLQVVAVGGLMSCCITMFLGRYINTEGIFSAPILEEPAKLLVVCLVIRRKNYPYAVNGLLIGMAVGAGFSIIENIFYSLRFYNEALFFAISKGAGPAVAMEYGLMEGVHTSMVRCIGDFYGHGIYAAFYGAALVLAKGREPLQLKHFGRPVFLFYFAVAMVFHALHNSGLYIGLPVFLDLVTSESVILGILSLAVLLPLVRRCVNQIVTITTEQNGGRVTMAVNRGRQDLPSEQPADFVREAGRPFLVGLSGPFRDQRIPLGPVTVLGRRPDCTLVLAGAGEVSGTHCRIQCQGPEVTLTDLNSTNGTYVNGSRLQPGEALRLTDGSEIRLGGPNVAFRLQIQ